MVSPFALSRLSAAAKWALVWACSKTFFRVLVADFQYPKQIRLLYAWSIPLLVSSRCLFWPQRPNCFTCCAAQTWFFHYKPGVVGLYNSELSFCSVMHTISDLSLHVPNSSPLQALSFPSKASLHLFLLLNLASWCCGVSFPKPTMVASSVITNRDQWNLWPYLANNVFLGNVPLLS